MNHRSGKTNSCSHATKSRPKTVRKQKPKSKQKKSLLSPTILETHTKQITPLNQSASHCPNCGGWIIVERVLDFYSRQTLQKCLNCGRILVNPFLPMNLAQSIGKQTSQSEPHPNKLDSTYFLSFHRIGESQENPFYGAQKFNKNKAINHDQKN